MSISSKLKTTGSPYSRNNGKTPSIPNLAGSTLHNSYSINGSPNLVNFHKPSSLDLDGKTPTKYSDQKFD